MIPNVFEVKLVASENCVVIRRWPHSGDVRRVAVTVTMGEPLGGHPFVHSCPHPSSVAGREQCLAILSMLKGAGVEDGGKQVHREFRRLRSWWEEDRTVRESPYSLRAAPLPFEAGSFFVCAGILCIVGCLASSLTPPHLPCQ